MEFFDKLRQYANEIKESIEDNLICLTEDNPISIIGQENSGKTNLAEYIMHQKIPDNKQATRIFKKFDNINETVIYTPSGKKMAIQISDCKGISNETNLQDEYNIFNKSKYIFVVFKANEIIEEKEDTVRILYRLSYFIDRIFQVESDNKNDRKIVLIGTHCDLITNYNEDNVRNNVHITTVVNLLKNTNHYLGLVLGSVQNNDSSKKLVNEQLFKLL